MIRYRCPHCAALIVAHERRVGQASVCKACLKPHPIPNDAALWLTETGEPSSPSAAPAVVHSPPAVAEPVPTPRQIVAEVAPEPVPEKPVELSPTVPEIHLSEPIVVDTARRRGPAPAFVVHEPEPAPAPPPTPPAVAREPEPAPPRVSRPVVRQPRTAPTAEPESGSVATATPPPQPVRKAVPASTPVPRGTGRFAGPVPPPRPNSDAPTYGEPVQLQTQADIAVALTAALTSRMKPPPAPRRDLRPSTAVWMLLTGLGIACVLVAVYTEANYVVSGVRIPALGIGLIQILIGYAWIVRLTYLRDPKRGRLCAVPPVTLYYLTQQKYAKFRPLRFVLTGVALVCLCFAIPSLVELTRPLVVAKSDPKPPPPDLATQSKLVQLRAHRDQRSYDALIKLLQVLAKTDPIRSADAGDRKELAAELEALCAHQLTHVRIEAMAAFTLWDTEPNAARARAVCLAAVRSSTEDERYRALQLLPRWKDAESARAVQSLIGRAGRQTNQARESLEEIGGPPAEQAALALLKRADDQSTRLIAIGILEQVGGPGTADELSRYAMAIDDPPVRTRALAAVAMIESRSPKRQP